MRIVFFTKLFTVILMLLLCAIGIMVFQALSIRDSIASSEDHRYRSLLLASELFQSSEDLTRMARAYATTGNPIYKRYFSIFSTSGKVSSRARKIIPTHTGILPTREKVLPLSWASPFPCSR